MADGHMFFRTKQTRNWATFLQDVQVAGMVNGKYRMLNAKRRRRIPAAFLGLSPNQRGKRRSIRIAVIVPGTGIPPDPWVHHNG